MADGTVADGTVADGTGAEGVAADGPAGHAAARRRRSPLDVVRRVPRELVSAVRDGVDDAREELATRTRDARTGLVLLGIGGALALVALTTLAVTTTIALAVVLPWWAAIASIVAPFAIAAGIVAGVGARRLRAGAPPVPTDAIGDTRRRVRRTLTGR